jgi:putative ABC transport system permease protein
VRWRDLVGLSLFALSRHKVRTLLTTLGVLFGTNVLVVSLSLRQGVQETVVRQVSQYVELRRVEVHPGRRAPEPPPLKGKMSEERRQRLKKLLEQGQATGPPKPQERLTPERVRELAAMEHVVRAQPVVSVWGRVYLGDQAWYTGFLGIPADLEAGIRARLLTGSMPEEGDLEGAVVSELLLYQLGVLDEDEQARAVGRTLTFEFREGGRPAPLFLLQLLTGGRSDKVSAGQEKVLGKVLERLPESLDRLGLSPQEQQAMREMLRPLKARPERYHTERASFRIRGVVRGPTPEEERRRGGWMLRQANLFLTPEAAEEFFLRMPQARELGFDQVVLQIDDPDNVKEVQKELADLGFQSQAAIEFIEREQFIYLVVFTGMSVVALVALVVAAIGITNTMLMSVLERVREIGIMKATGARDGHVQALFLMEGALVGLVGGLLGLALAGALAYPADAYLGRMVEQRLHIKLTGSLFAFPWWLVLGAPALAVAVATLAAWYPARRAVRIDPVQALRHE